MEAFRTWIKLAENRRGLNSDELHLLIHELDAHPVSIKGSGIFPITYSVVVNVSETK